MKTARKQIIDSLIGKQKIVIWGTGELGKKLITILRNSGFDISILCEKNTNIYCDMENQQYVTLEELLKIDNKEDYVVFLTFNNKNNEAAMLERYGFNRIYGKELVLSLIYNFPEVEDIFTWKSCRPFNHYESPYPSIHDIVEREEELFDRKTKVLDVDLNEAKQLSLMNDFIQMYDSSIKWNGEDQTYRYKKDNTMFPIGDAFILQSMLRWIKPKRVIEIGSGYSTAVMLDTNEKFFDQGIKIYSIEPYAQRLKKLLKDNETALELTEDFLQNIPLSYFEQLESGDILFVDSSHVANFNSDVNYIFFEILPRLKPGVHIHFHDIPYPFIYPKEWIYEGRAYSEMYVLRAFLANNKDYKIQYFNNMMSYLHKSKYQEGALPLGGSGIWIKKL